MQTPKGQAITPKHQRIQALEPQVKRLEMEKAIKKKRRRSWARMCCPLCINRSVTGRLSNHHTV